MQIHSGPFEGVSHLTRGCIATAGTYDGVHLGHRQILSRLTGLAHERGVPSVVITYWPHPRLVLYPEQTDLRLLSTRDERRALLADVGIDHLLEIPFSPALSEMSYEAYVRQVLWEGLGLGCFVVGYDHQFGHQRQGGWERLLVLSAELGFDLEQIPAHQVEAVNVSSSRIRAALASGELETATRLLGRPYRLSGLVVQGRQLGRTLGYPTANLDIDPLKLLPAQGVYLVGVGLPGELGCHRPGLMNIGLNPTVEGKGFSVEVFLMDYSGDLYGQTLEVELLDYLRPEEKFDSLEALVAAMDRDQDKGRALWEARQAGRI